MVVQQQGAEVLVGLAGMACWAHLRARRVAVAVRVPREAPAERVAREVPVHRGLMALRGMV